MEFDASKAFPAFVNAAPNKRSAAKTFDPWAAPDPFIGTKPKPLPDVFENIDFRDAEFRQFAKDEFDKPRKVIRQTYRDPLFGARPNILGQSDE